MSGQDAAVAAAGRGWAVFPCRPGDKRPAVDRWEERACSAPARVARYWPSPRHNAGVACGPSGLVVVDLDTSPDDALGIQERIAPYGAARLAEVCREHGQAWPDTYTVTTPSGGWHLYYVAIPGREVRNSASKIAPKVDVRGTGGYVVAAGSMVNGSAYHVTDDRPVAPLPAWLADLAAPPQRERAPAAIPSGAGSRYALAALRRQLAELLAAPQGCRNDTLNRSSFALGQLVAAGLLDRDQTAAVLEDAGQRIGLDTGEVRRSVASGLAAGERFPRGGAA